MKALSTILIFWCSSSVLRMSDPASNNYIIWLEELRTMSLNDSVNTLCNDLAMKIFSKLFCILRLLILKILTLGIYLSPLTIAWLLHLLEHHTFVLLEWTQSYINQLNFNQVFLLFFPVWGCVSCREMLWGNTINNAI